MDTDRVQLAVQPCTPEVHGTLIEITRNDLTTHHIVPGRQPPPDDTAVDACDNGGPPSRPPISGGR